MPERDEVLEALDVLVAALQENSARNEMALRRARAIKEARAQGLPYIEIISEEHRPLIVELTTENLENLYAAGSKLRRAEARALHQEGLSMEKIGKLFGVTRQRVQALLRDGRSREEVAVNGAEQR